MAKVNQQENTVRHLFFHVSGMTCSSCSSTVQNCLQNTPGVLVATVSLERETAYVKCDQDLQNDLLQRLESIGFECKPLSLSDNDLNILKEEMLEEYNRSHQKKSDTGITPTVASGWEFYCKIEGMTCSSCSGQVESCLKGIEGVEGVAVSLAQQVAYVQASKNVAKEIPASIVAVGFGAELVESSSVDASVALHMKQSMKSAESQQQQHGGHKQRTERRDSEEEGRESIVIEMVGSQVLAMSVDGMTCTSCSSAVERALMSHPGVASATVNLATDTAMVSFDPEFTGPRDIVQAVEDAGYGCQVLDSDQPNLEEMEAIERRKNRKRLHILLLSTSISLPILLISMVFKHTNDAAQKELYDRKVIGKLALGPLLMWILCTPVQFGIGWRFYWGAYKGWRNKVFGMDFLIAMGTSAAYLYSAFAAVQCLLNQACTKDTSFFETSAMLITFVLLGKYLEGLVKGKTTEALTKLLSYQAQSAILINVDGTEREVDAKMIHTGDVIKLLRGSKVPADGVVAWGEVSMDESMITGESVPVLRGVGDPLIGGTVCVEGLARMEVQKTGKDTTLQQIVNLVETAQTSKAPIQNYADRISHVFVPMVVLIATVTFIVWMLLLESGALPQSWFGGLTKAERVVVAVKFAVAVLVVACPCALGLATPTAIMTGTGTAALNGILIKGGAILQQTNNITTIIFDKTGTLTQGKPTVSDFHVVVSEDQTESPSPNFVVKERFFPKELLALFAAVENNSEHPLAKAITDYARTHNITEFSDVANFVATSGKGVTGYVSGHHVFIGTAPYVKEKGVKPLSASTKSMIQTMQWQGKTVICGGIDGDLVAIFGIVDQIRDEARRTISHLRSAGISVYMVTGDSKRTAVAVAKELALPEEFVFAEVLPQFKSETVKELQNRSQVVAMVGDGINDAPALAQADLGIAIGAGTDIAIEAADLVLMKSRVTDVITTIDISRRIFRRIKLNFLWALGYNCLGIPIASGAFYPLLRATLPPMVAGAAMALSSICVVISSLALKLYRPPAVAREDWSKSKEGRKEKNERRNSMAPISAASNKVENVKKAWIERTSDGANTLYCDCTCPSCQDIRKTFREGSNVRFWEDICTDEAHRKDSSSDELISEVTALLESKVACSCIRCHCEHHEHN